MAAAVFALATRDPRAPRWALCRIRALRISSSTPHAPCHAPHLGARGLRFEFPVLAIPAGYLRGAVPAIAAVHTEVLRIYIRTLHFDNAALFCYNYLSASRACWTSAVDGDFVKMMQVGRM